MHSLKSSFVNLVIDFAKSAGILALAWALGYLLLAVMPLSLVPLVIAGSAGILVAYVFRARLGAYVLASTMVAMAVEIVIPFGYGPDH
jgi:hypothetical protein